MTTTSRFFFTLYTASIEDLQSFPALSYDRSRRRDMPPRVEMLIHELQEDASYRWAKAVDSELEAQRRGAGSMLLRWIAAEADNLGLPAYLESTTEGRDLYERHG